MRETTLNARAFLQIDVEHPEAEEVRLQELYSQISNQPRNTIKRLVREFLAIIEDPRSKLGFRIQACNILGSRKTELRVTKSKLITAKLRKVLRREFFESKHSRLFSLKRELRLRETGPIKFCFLEALLLTLLRIDADDSHKFVESVTSMVQDVEKTTELIDLLKKANK